MGHDSFSPVNPRGVSGQRPSLFLSIFGLEENLETFSAADHLKPLRGLGYGQNLRDQRLKV
jgi:hypothetical protein